MCTPHRPGAHLPIHNTGSCFATSSGVNVTRFSLPPASGDSSHLDIKIPRRARLRVRRRSRLRVPSTSQCVRTYAGVYALHACFCIVRMWTVACRHARNSIVVEAGTHCATCACMCMHVYVCIHLANATHPVCGEFVTCMRMYVHACARMHLYAHVHKCMRTYRSFCLRGIGTKRVSLYT